MTKNMTQAPKFAPKPNGAGEMFQLFRDGNPRTRAELTTITGQSRSTIAARLDILHSMGLIGPAGEASSTGGRPPAVFAFTPGIKIVIGVDVGATHIGVALTDLAANILQEHREIANIARGPELILQRVGEIAHELISHTDHALDDVVAVGIGLPGPVDHSTGRPITPPIMPGWNDADVPEILHRHLGGPLDLQNVLVDNDVNVMALGEHAKAYPDVNHLLFVKIATGIGSGVIMDGALRRGAQGAAGDLGHVAIPANTANTSVTNGLRRQCRCGNTGCLEAIASGGALIEDLQRQGFAVETVDNVVNEVQQGNVEISQAVRDAGRTIGEVLATCVSLFNPSLIVIGGVLAQAGDHLLAGIREVVYRRSLPLATQNLRIATTKTGIEAGVYGAAVLAADHVLSAEAVEHAIFNGQVL